MGSWTDALPAQEIKPTPSYHYDTSTLFNVLPNSKTEKVSIETKDIWFFLFFSSWRQYCRLAAEFYRQSTQCWARTTQQLWWASAAQNWKKRTWQTVNNENSEGRVNLKMGEHERLFARKASCQKYPNSFSNFTVLKTAEKLKSWRETCFEVSAGSEFHL